MSDGRVWFITGASRGLGRGFTEAALERGDRVVAAARDVGPLGELAAAHPDRLVRLSLDVRDPAAVRTVVDRAAAAFGRLDVVVNNAGTVLLGMVEEATEEEIRAQFDVNFVGAVWVTQAVVPHLRAQGSGHLLQVTTMGTGGGVASVGFYAAGKSALDSLSQALAMEPAPFGLKVTIVQPGGVRDRAVHAREHAGRSAAGVRAAARAAGRDVGRRGAAGPGHRGAGRHGAGRSGRAAAAADRRVRLVRHGPGDEDARAEEYRAWEHLGRRAPG